MITPGRQAVAQRLGGGWIWNATTKMCMTSMQFVVSSGPAGAGFCTEVASRCQQSGLQRRRDASAAIEEGDRLKGRILLTTC